MNIIDVVTIFFYVSVAVGIYAACFSIVYKDHPNRYWRSFVDAISWPILFGFVTACRLMDKIEIEESDNARDN
jgi:hypothetical protein